MEDSTPTPDPIPETSLISVPSTPILLPPLQSPTHVQQQHMTNSPSEGVIITTTTTSTATTIQRAPTQQNQTASSLLSSLPLEEPFHAYQDAAISSVQSLASTFTQMGYHLQKQQANQKYHDASMNKRLNSIQAHINANNHSIKEVQQSVNKLNEKFDPRVQDIVDATIKSQNKFLHQLHQRLTTLERRAPSLNTNQRSMDTYIHPSYIPINEKSIGQLDDLAIRLTEFENHFTRADKQSYETRLMESRQSAKQRRQEKEELVNTLRKEKLKREKLKQQNGKYEDDTTISTNATPTPNTKITAASPSEVALAAASGTTLDTEPSTPSTRSNTITPSPIRNIITPSSIDTPIYSTSIDAIHARDLQSLNEMRDDEILSWLHDEEIY